MYVVEQWKTVEKESSRKSKVITAVLSALLLLIMYFWMLGWPRESEIPLAGMMIDFGTTETGGGQVAPPKTNSQPTVTEPVTEPVTTPTNPPSNSNPEVTPTTPDEVVTQDVEEAPAITPVEEDPKPTQEEIEAAQAALEAQQQAEAEAKAKAEAEAKAAAEAAAAAQAQAEADELKDLLDGALNNSGDGTGNGPNGGDGDFGAPNGVPNGGQGWGTDGDGDGVWGLGSRGWARKPNIDNGSQEFGTVVLKIKVDKQGNIISAVHTPHKDNTTTSRYLIDLAIREVKRQGKITSDVNASSEAWGYIKINFKPN